MMSGSIPAMSTQEGAMCDVTFTVNGAARTLRIDPRMTLLDAVRDELGLT